MRGAAAAKVSHEVVARVVMEAPEDHVRTERISKLGPVQLMLEGMQVAIDQ